MSRVRIALAGLLVLAGVAGALLVLWLAGGDDAKPNPPPAVTTADGARIEVVAGRSLCRLARGADVAEFRVVLHNPSRLDREAQLRAAIGNRGEAAVLAVSPARTVALLATERRAYAIDVPFDASEGTPDRCSVSLDGGAAVPIRAQPAG